MQLLIRMSIISSFTFSFLKRSPSGSFSKLEMKMRFHYCLSINKKIINILHELNSKVVLQVRKLKGAICKSFMKLGYVFCLARSNSVRWWGPAGC